jgi:dihydroneopterin aldolase
MTIVLTNLEFYAYHGVPDAEQEVGHRYRVTAELRLTECGAEKSDDIAETLDYAAAAAVILEIGTGRQYRTLERLANEMGDSLLAEFPSLASVEILVAKIAPPMPFILESVSVTVICHR